MHFNLDLLGYIYMVCKHFCVQLKCVSFLNVEVAIHCTKSNPVYQLNLHCDPKVQGQKSHNGMNVSYGSQHKE